MGAGFFVAQGAQVVIVLDCGLHLQELPMGQDDQPFASVTFDDLRVEFHGRLPRITYSLFPKPGPGKA